MVCLSFCPINLFRRKQKNKTYGKFCDLPRELLEDIFCRLSVKDIIRLRSVCKTWYVIINHHRFISMHADWCANNHKGYLIHRSGCQISRFDQGFDFKERLKFPIPVKFCLIGSWDGLICVRSQLSPDNIAYPSTYIWNPSIRKLKKLPDTKHHLQYHDVIARSYFVSAFGFDGQTNDYKVFHTSLLKLKSKQELIIYKLYSLKTNSWKEINGNIQGNDHPSLFPYHYRGCRTYFCGAFYWIQSRLYPAGSRFMMWFDFCNERIWKTKLPIDDDNESVMSIGHFKNSIVLYISDARQRRDIFQSGPCTIDTWMMKKLSSTSGEVVWERQLSLVIPYHLAWPLTTGLKGEILLYKYCCLDDFELYFRFGVYDSMKQNIRHLDTHLDGDPSVDENLNCSFSYSESLFLLGDGDTY